MSVLSRHRLPQPYRGLLIASWLLPLALLWLALLLGRGPTPSLFDPRLLLLLGLMTLPAVYIWQEGVDVRPDGLFIRQHVPRFRPFHELDTYYVDSRPNRRLLTVWDQQQRKALETHLAHLTDVPELLRHLHTHLRWRGWPGS